MTTPRDLDAVRRSVREKSKEWFDWAKSEMIPYWRSEYDELLRDLPTNVLARADMAEIVAAHGFRGKHSEVLRDLFDLGLIGCVVQNEDDTFTQRFRQNDPELPVTQELFEASTHYVVHPCVNLATRPLKTKYAADVHNIVGHGYPFVSGSQRLHVHFGMGALGVGLVLPLLSVAPGVSIAVVQRKSSRWALSAKWRDSAQLFRRIRGHGGDVSAARHLTMEMRVHSGAKRTTLDELMRL